MTEDFEKKLTSLKEDLQKGKNLKIKAETRLEELNKQRTDILVELENLGIKYENLDKEIDKTTKEIKELFNQIELLIPKDILK
jgi:chromosome segregation ATPase